MASYDSSKQSNLSKRSGQVYRDLNLDFLQNSATKDIQKLLDVESVKRSVRNLINTNHYEKPFHPEIGSNVNAVLFEPMNPITANSLTRVIEETIVNFEPRARLVQINVQPFIERNGYRAQISFFVVNTPERVEMESFLERLR